MAERDPSFAGPGPDAQFREGLEKGEFLIQHCAACGRHVFYPRAICVHCGSPKLAMVRASGRGTVYSTSVVRQRPEDGPDYNVALVDLAEGPRMMTRVIDIAPDKVAIGMAVEGRVGDIDGTKAIVFRPVEAGGS